MKILVEFTPEEGLEDLEFDASDCLIVYRKMVPFANKDGKTELFPQTFAHSVDGGAIREISKEALQWCVEWASHRP